MVFDKLRKDFREFEEKRASERERRQLKEFDMLKVQERRLEVGEKLAREKQKIRTLKRKKFERSPIGRFVTKTGPKLAKRTTRRIESRVRKLDKPRRTTKTPQMFDITSGFGQGGSDILGFQKPRKRKKNKGFDDFPF